MTLMLLRPDTSVIDATDQAVVPEAVPLVLLAEFDQVTLVTPMLSEAVPASVVRGLVAVT